MLLYYLGELFQDSFGPARLFTSRLFLGGFGVIGSFLVTFVLLPKLAKLLPRDRGREHAVNAKQSEGKPTGAGIIFISIFLIIQVLTLPVSFQPLAILFLALLAMLSGWFDDNSNNAWGEYKKAFIDLILSVATAVVLCGLEPVTIWLPFTKVTLSIASYLFIPLAAILIWTAINATNCTDGVDGLSGTLAAIALTALGGLLYFVLGHQKISAYLLLPHYVEGATWAMMAFSLVGTILGYLWYNAHPSSMLMGDAGSRAIGFLIGVFVIKTGNPFLILVAAGVLLINGGTGLVKVALLRFAKIAIFKDIRFPIHDHVRHKKGWSNTQVLVRFSVLQMIITLVLIVLLVKIR
jgi:phospho-N-acetylmuramoyl-pentapeptide-transferase